MSQIQSIIQRIFGNHKLPTDLPGEEYEKYMQKNIPQWVKEFEDGGFLDKTKLPEIQSEEELIEKLLLHRNDLMVIKYWKHGCIPCLAFAEMYKAAAEMFTKDTSPNAKRVFWYSVDTKAFSAWQLAERQLISGTPTIQTFANQKQCDDEIKATNMDELMQEIRRRAEKELQSPFS
ncbi:unnamed protein product [Phytomonas sp. Hart1]|nr:unnamed protein product [Phytomonas sp. Hart1]|eukprot:CCW66223.1 unnamed protein product [Phytomonas sp. isolate Hart1]